MHSTPGSADAVRTVLDAVGELVGGVGARLDEEDGHVLPVLAAQANLRQLVLHICGRPVGECHQRE